MSVVSVSESVENQPIMLQQGNSMAADPYPCGSDWMVWPAVKNHLSHGIESLSLGQGG